MDDNGEIQWINIFPEIISNRKELLGFKLETVDADLKIVKNLDDDKDNVVHWKDKYFQIVYHNDIECFI